MMAARGLVPLPPADQLAVLYQLSLDADQNVVATARGTATGLPERLLAGTLVDTHLDPRVLEYFGQLYVDKQTIFDAVVLNPSVTDPTIAALAGRADARGVDLISQNEQRVLRHPEIIAAMYMNRRARMSTIDRVVELAVRNGVRVPGLAAWDEVARALTGNIGPADDEAFDVLVTQRDDSVLTTGDGEQPLAEDDEAQVEAARNDKLIELHITRRGMVPVRIALRRMRMTIGGADACDATIPDAPAQWLVVQLDDAGAMITIVATREQVHLDKNRAGTVDGARIVLQDIPFRDMPIPFKIRAATLGDAFIRSEAIRDPMKLVSMAAIKSPGVTDIEAARYAGNSALAEDVIRYIAANRGWQKTYAVKVALCKNPKTPLTDASRLLQLLRERDLTTIMRSKGVSSAVVAQARKLQTTRHGRK
jgi:hypothetical protein